MNNLQKGFFSFLILSLSGVVISFFIFIFQKISFVNNENNIKIENEHLNAFQELSSLIHHDIFQYLPLFLFIISLIAFFRTQDIKVFIAPFLITISLQIIPIMFQ